MKDSGIQQKADKLKILVSEVNNLMKELQELNVEVRISYSDKKTGDNPSPQAIYLWKIEEHNTYLTDE